MLCVPASIAVFISIIAILFDYEIYNGFIPVVLFTDIFLSIILIVVIQWFCSKIGMGVAWLTIVSISALSFYGLYLWRTHDPVFTKFVEEEKAKTLKDFQSKT
jgi:hypothetical protein